MGEEYDVFEDYIEVPCLLQKFGLDYLAYFDFYNRVLNIPKRFLIYEIEPVEYIWTSGKVKARVNDEKENFLEIWIQDLFNRDSLIVDIPKERILDNFYYSSYFI